MVRFLLAFLRPIRLIYALIFLAAISLTLIAFHSIEAFEDKIYSLREGYLNELTHALVGPLATLEKEGIQGSESLKAVFQPFEALQNPGLYDIETDHQRLLQLLLTDREGTVLYDSTHTSVGLNIRGRPEVAAALSGVVHRRDEDEGHGIYRMYVGVPVRTEGVMTGALIASKSNVLLKPLVIAVEQGMLFILLAAGMIGVLILLTAYLLLYRPIEIWLGRLDLARGGTPILRPNLRRRRFGRIGLLLDRMHETISEKRHMEQMVACLAHEMKNPINAVRTHVELLGRIDDEALGERLLSEIKACCDRMTNVTERLLVIAAIERRETLEELHPVRIGNIVDAAINRHQREADQSDIRLMMAGDADLLVRCEPVLMELAIGNLIQNAIDHSPPDRSVLITLDKQGKTLLCEVRDHGYGIPDHALNQIFDKYFTLPKATTGRQGTGIGLNVVQHVVDLHYGSISLKNHPEGGVLAVLTVPV
jgi:two-component system sensor histidine kinase CreC